MKLGVCFAPTSSVICGKVSVPAQPREGCVFLFQQIHSGNPAVKTVRIDRAVAPPLFGKSTGYSGRFGVLSFRNALNGLTDEGG